MKKYQEYRDSQHSWEKCIPNNWKCMKLQYCLSLLTDYTANGSFASLAKNVQYLDKPDYSRLVRLTDLRENLENDGIWITKDAHEFLEKSELFGGEIVLANVGAYTGLVCRIPPIKGKASLAPNMFLLKFKEILENNFMFYALLSYFCNEQLKLFATSTAQPKLNKDNTKAVRIFVPSKSEQQLISQYLDQKTQQIDILIEKKRKMIELLKEERAAIINQAVTKGINPDAEMKDSGIEWLGEVPKHWGIKRVKHVLDFYDSIRKPLSSDERGKMQTKQYDYYGASGIIDKVDDYLFEGEYILVGEDGANLLSRSTPLAFKACGKFWVNNHAHILKPKGENILAYYVHLLETLDYTVLVTGSAQPKLTQEALGNQIIIEPTIKDQISIVEFIKDKEKKILSSILHIEKELALIEEYRTALINEAVTGKIKVTESV